MSHKRVIKERDLEVLSVIDRSVRENQYPPTLREIADVANYASTSAVVYCLEHMQELGLIERDARISRGLRITDRGVEILKNSREIGIL